MVDRWFDYKISGVSAAVEIVRASDYDALHERASGYRDRLLAALERAASAEARGAILDQYGDCGHGMIYQYGGGPCLACSRDALVARLAELEAERTGTIHESWQHKTHAELLEGLKWQGAITKSLLASNDELQARVAEAERDAARYRWLRDSSVNDVDAALFDKAPSEWDASIDAFLRPADSAPAVRCDSCDGTGDLIRADGEWLGRCSCPAGSASEQESESHD